MSEKKWTLDLMRSLTRISFQDVLRREAERVKEDGDKAYDRLLKSRGL